MRQEQQGVDEDGTHIGFNVNYIKSQGIKLSNSINALIKTSNGIKIRSNKDLGKIRSNKDLGKIH